MKLIAEKNSLPRLLAFVYLIVAGLVGLLLTVAERFIVRAAYCPMRSWFDIPCPTCGGTHAAMALANGDLGEAIRQNPLVAVVALGLVAWVAFAIVATAVPRWRRQIAWTKSEKNVLRVLAVGAIVAVWLYEILRLT